MNSEIDMNNYESFLKELTELTKKYRIVIGGCGCCQSPWMSAYTKDAFKAQVAGEYQRNLMRGRPELEWVQLSDNAYDQLLKSME